MSKVFERSNIFLGMKVSDNLKDEINLNLRTWAMFRNEWLEFIVKHQEEGKCWGQGLLNSELVSPASTVWKSVSEMDTKIFIKVYSISIHTLHNAYSILVILSEEFLVGCCRELRKKCVTYSWSGALVHIRVTNCPASLLYQNQCCQICVVLGLMCKFEGYPRAARYYRANKFSRSSELWVGLFSRAGIL